ncbi:hypothetical protein A1O1_00156 [Capronia coronata CBS 617.96]|uniref:Uncharacterized protein n=1 Tax=Capronia coronata CBS 617.96 TaxID=1182541 RepID=W9YR60_9EURO|nr:uncharacterized protein A1O1_00156 [Capronia coronata CBS 617.96]EXJ95038.1 hypothetical protein A1O1_00156 [Capronia coronata CBS 617.96]
MTSNKPPSPPTASSFFGAEDSEGPSSSFSNSNSSSTIDPVYSRRLVSDDVPGNHKSYTRPISDSEGTHTAKGTADNAASSRVEAAGDDEEGPIANSNSSSSQVNDPVYGQSVTKAATPGQTIATGKGAGQVSPATDPVYSQSQPRSRPESPIASNRLGQLSSQITSDQGKPESES